MFLWLIVGSVVVLTVVLVLYLMDQVYLDVAGRYILVTGCDTGFGNILARGLGRKRGCHVIAACLTKAGMESVTTGAPQGSVTPILMDVTDTKSILKVRDKVAKIVAGKGLWGLVNNAGVTGIPLPYHWLKKQEIQHILDVNLMGTIQVTNVFFPLLRQAQGRIVNVSSATAVLPRVLGGYSISKIGVEAFSDAMRVSSKPFGVTVHILEPGYFKTNLTSLESVSLFQKVLNRLPQEEKDVYGQKYFESMVERGKVVMENLSTSLHLVTDAMEHALCSRWPWRRYMPGNDIKFIFKPLSMLPAWLTDFILGHLATFKLAPPNASGIGQSNVVTFAADD